jgi:hypothetical protein
LPSESGDGGEKGEIIYMWDSLDLERGEAWKQELYVEKEKVLVTVRLEITKSCLGPPNVYSAKISKVLLRGRKREGEI